MKHEYFSVNFVVLLVFSCCVFLLYASPVKADPIIFSSDFLNTDLTDILKDLFKVVDGSVDHTIDETELNSLKIIGSVPHHSVSFYRKSPREIRDNFSSDRPSNVVELGLDSGASKALINFIGASAF